jgi:hypothetical protein
MPLGNIKEYIFPEKKMPHLISENNITILYYFLLLAGDTLLATWEIH